VGGGGGGAPGAPAPRIRPCNASLTKDLYIVALLYKSLVWLTDLMATFSKKKLRPVMMVAGFYIFVTSLDRRMASQLCDKFLLQYQ
jgi:hypothetical protein